MSQLKLPNNIFSQQDLKALIVDVQKYAKWYAQTSVKMRYDKGTEAEQPAVLPASAEIINDWAGDEQLTQRKLEDLIVALEDYAAAAPYLTITLAAPPSNRLKQSLIDWCRQNINPDLLINFKFNTTILGGMVLIYDSHIYDWSFRRKILAERQKFAGVLRNV